MDSLLKPDIVSGPLQVVEVKDEGEGLETGTSLVRATLTAPVSNEFIDRWRDARRVVTTRVNQALMGVELDVRDYDFDQAELRKSKGGRRGRLTLEMGITRVEEGVDLPPLSKSLTPVDAQLGRVVLVDPAKKIERVDLAALVGQIAEQSGAQEFLAYDVDSEKAFIRPDVSWMANIKNGGAVLKEDILRFAFGMRDPDALEDVLRVRQVHPDVKEFILRAGSSAIFRLQGFWHDSALGVMENTGSLSPVGSRVFYPRKNPGAYEKGFRTRLVMESDVLREDVKIPVSFYDTGKSKSRIRTGGEASAEPFAVIDTEVAPSYPATDLVFSMLDKKDHLRNAVFVRDQADFKAFAKGDLRRAKCYRDAVRTDRVNVLALAEDPDISEYADSFSPASSPELAVLEEAKKDVEKKTRDGVLFCTYFPGIDILHRLPEYANQLRAIVFKYPAFVPTASPDAKPAEHHGFGFGAEVFMAMREFHGKYPHIKLIWSNEKVGRNLTFVDPQINGTKGKLPVFVKPELVEYMRDPDSTISVSFCGSSTVKAEPGREQELKLAEKEERDFTEMYCKYITDNGKKPVGINGGGPDVMERNGKHLQELGAVSVATGCDLSKAGQYAHTKWDAVMSLSSTPTDFALREDLLLSGNIVHMAPGGIGTIQEILGILAHNKLKMGAQRILLVDRGYWKGQIEQLVEALRKDNIKPENLELLFVVDTPEEARQVLLATDAGDECIKKRRALWEKMKTGECDYDHLFDYGEL